MKDERTIYNTPKEEIQRILKEQKLAAKTQYLRKCPICEEDFEAKRVDKLFCSDRCRWVWHQVKKHLEAGG